MTDWSLYIVRAGDGSLYTGIATDVERRLTEHREGTRGAKYLRGRGPLELVYRRAVGDRGQAQKLEAGVKALPKSTKERLVAESLELEDLLELAAGSE